MFGYECVQQKEKKKKMKIQNEITGCNLPPIRGINRDGSFLIQV
jgi:hypothetical protein